MRPNLYTPTSQEIDAYVAGLRENIPLLKLDSLILPYFETLLDSGWVPIASCQGHMYSQNGYFSFLYHPALNPVVGRLTESIFTGELGLCEYGLPEEGDSYMAINAQVEFGLSTNAHLFNKECGRHDVVRTVLLRWWPYGEHKANIDIAMEMLLSAIDGD